MRGNFLHGNRESPETPAAEESAGRSGKAECRTPDMHVVGQSDSFIVPEIQPNKAGENAAAEVEEGRELTKGNSAGTAAFRTQSRGDASIGLCGVRRRAQKDKEVRFTALLHHITFELLRDSFYALKRQASPGIDGVTWKQYQIDLERRLTDLHRQVHQGTYRAQAGRRSYIPKADGRMRPLGIAALEDKIVQQATVTVLNQIYEEDFLNFSYGFRPGRSQHDALDALWVGIMGKKVNWVLDADIRGFFDNLNHEWLMKFLAHRIGDRRMLRLVRKWLKAGVWEDGRWTKSERGTPQGAVISPLLANIYLHYVLDLWVRKWRKTAAGDVIMIRYADDFILGFQHRGEAERFLTELHDRLKGFGLELHPDKTRLVEFGRFAVENRKKRGEGKPEVFDFLGFTHICSSKRISRGFIVKRKTAAGRLRRRLQEMKQELMRRRHCSIIETGVWLRSVVQGYFNYHAVPGNMNALSAFRTQTARYWLHALRRRSQRHRMNWERFAPIADRWIPKAKILHPYPNVRFYAKHPR